MGMHHDGIHYFPLRAGRDRNRGLLVMNHEYVDQTLLFGYPADEPGPPLTEAQLALALAAHGVSVIEIREHHDEWEMRSSRYARRITGDTPVAFSGPVTADHPLLDTGAEPRGTLNNCAMGHTPWGTYLTCEENFDGYFGATAAFVPDETQDRYGFSAEGSGYQWHTAPGSRFDLSANPNEANRFGWVVEIDPYHPENTPVKRTALGRLKHEGAFAHESCDGRVVVYMGDDEDGEHLYKFVSAEPPHRMTYGGTSPLDEGTLYVAQFADDGSGVWLPLVHGEGPLTVENRWVDQADVLIRTRLAATAIGATKLDRPEWTAVDQRSGACYVALTNGSGDRGATSGTRGAANGKNPYGQIVRWFEDDNEHSATSFTWDVFAFAGDPTKPTPDTSVDDEDRFSSPDGLFADRSGRLWIQTDVSSSRLNTGNFDRLGNNQMLCADPDTGEIRRFLSGPEGCEITGATMTPDQRTMFINIQHPGEEQPSTFPFGTTPARSCTVAIRRVDGGVVGT
jgi:secreted PhoX family phosphatase